jgi:hypothetical protein
LPGDPLFCRGFAFHRYKPAPIDEARTKGFKFVTIKNRAAKGGNTMKAKPAKKPAKKTAAASKKPAVKKSKPRSLKAGR